MGDPSTKLAQVLGREHDLSARRHNIFDDEQMSPGDISPLGEFTRPILFGPLPDEKGRQAGELGKHSRKRNTPQFQASQGVNAGRNQRPQRYRNFFEQLGLRFEQILVEIFVCNRPGSQTECAFQVRDCEDASGEVSERP